MQLGLSLPQIGDLGTPEDVARVATRAEAVGFDSLWVMDRLMAPRNPRDPYPGTPDLGWPEAFRSCLDPLETLTFAAALTDRVALGTSVLNVPWYRPLTLARRLATLDVLSRGRLRMGVGLGWSQDEFAALGVPMAQLGRRLDDHLDALEAIWSHDGDGFDGDGYRIAPAAIGPRPVLGPRPPLYLGAFTDAGLQRIARRADGWLTVFLPAEVVTAMFGRVRELTAAAGRDPDAMRLVVRANPTILPSRTAPGPTPFVGTVDQVADELVTWAELGVDELHVDLQFSPGVATVDHLLDLAEQLHTSVRARTDHAQPVGAASR
jgi:probable F420-dependent oxidoreductase